MVSQYLKINATVVGCYHLAFFLQNYFEKNVEKYQLLFLLKSHRSKRDRSETYNLNLKTVSTFFYLITCIE